MHGIGDRDERRVAVLEMLADVGLTPEQADRRPHAFSGGQRQRIGIARAFVLRPDVVILDEPISALDVSVQAQVLNLLRRLQTQLGLTYVFISHDLAVAEYFCDRVAVLYLGQVMELADRDVLFRKPLHPYSVSLLSAVARAAGRRALAPRPARAADRRNQLRHRPPARLPVRAALPRRARARRSARASGRRWCSMRSGTGRPAISRGRWLPRPVRSRSERSLADRR